ncbi:MAG: hypothetical protein AAF078_03345 [Planctomycetota bacterium]
MTPAIDNPPVRRPAREGIAAWVALALGLLPIFAGCGTVQQAQEQFRHGELALAEASLAEIVQREGLGQPDSVLAHLEYGSVLHHTGKLDESTAVFMAAEQRIGEIDRQAELRLSDEAAGLLLNPSERRYIGTPYDRVMSPFYRGLNALLLGDTESPRQAFVAMAEAQDVALEFRRKQIDEALASGSDASSARLDLDRSRDSREARRAFEARYGPLDGYEPYGDYTVPVADWLRAVYLIGAGQTAGDADRARTILLNLAKTVPGNPHVLDDSAMADEVVRGTPPPPTTYVLFATGVAPSRETFRVDLPLFLVNDEVDYAGVAFPYLEFHGRYVRRLRVVGDEASVKTAVITDMDRIVAADFDAELPAIIARALLSAATKTAAAWAINEGSGDHVAANILTFAYQVWQNQADERTWATLPKQFQYARIPTPASGVVRVSAADELDVAVDVEAGRMNLIYVRSVMSGSPATVYHTVLD